MLTPHIKRKKCKNKFYNLPHETHAAEERKESHDAARKKKERKEKKKEEGRRNGAEQSKQTIQAGHRDPPLGLVGRGSARPTVFFFFFFPSDDLGSSLGFVGRISPSL
jgi:hypothetical protein